MDWTDWTLRHCQSWNESRRWANLRRFEEPCSDVLISAHFSGPVSGRRLPSGRAAARSLGAEHAPSQTIRLLFEARETSFELRGCRRPRALKEHF